ncbi:MAG: amino acid ABC transporter substrate-binding protein [Synechococcales cyanobacterium M58_A2018_015]|nr:amino acid ABC transporter substrate-binding protein [Synechococcales cyanobacterium M58_A2018_015]
MSQKNETPVLVLSLLATLLLLAGGFWWFSRRLQPSDGTSNQAATPSDVSVPDSPQDLANRLSSGERLLTSDASVAKQAGVAAYAAQDYAQAVSELEAALQTRRNDPEALIYLNNARIGADPAYTIAVAVPIATSVNPALEILRGVAQAQQEINEGGGVNGTPVKILIVSDDNDPQVAQQMANLLVQYQEVLGVIGHFGSDATLAAGNVYEQGRLVMISPTSTSVQVSSLGNYIFRTVPSDRFTAAALSRYMLNSLQRQNAAVYYNSMSDYSQSLKNEFATALSTDGGQVVAEFDLADPSFSALDTLKQAAQQEAEVLVLASNTATLDPALQVVAVNRGNLPLLGGDSIYNPKTLQVGGESAVGMVVAVPWVLLANPQSAFVRTAKTLWGGDVNWRTAMAYDATLALAAALQQDSSRDGVQQALSRPGFSVMGATGTVRFLPSGDRNQAMQLVVVEPGARSGYGYDFVPVSR